MRDIFKAAWKSSICKARSAHNISSTSTERPGGAPTADIFARNNSALHARVSQFDTRSANLRLVGFSSTKSVLGSTVDECTKEVRTLCLVGNGASVVSDVANSVKVAMKLVKPRL